MAKCKLCERSGLFLFVTPDGLCANCNGIVVADVTQHRRIINDSARLVQQSSKLDTQLSRLDLLLGHTQALLQYEQRGIPSIDPPPSVLLREYDGVRDHLILGALRKEVEAATAKSEAATSTRTKLGPLSKVLAKVREYQSQADNRETLLPVDAEIMGLIHTIQLSDYLEKAKKAEFKGQRKKALDQYYEALYFLRTDGIEDTLQQSHISALEGKITELGGELPSMNATDDVEITFSDEGEE